jgi:hypothetical protein
MAAWPQKSIGPGRRSEPSEWPRGQRPANRAIALAVNSGFPAMARGAIKFHLPLFRTDSSLFSQKKSDHPEKLRTVRGLLHSQPAFGIGLPLTASDRRHLGCGCSSVVEHDLAKVGVEGSSPFARSRFLKSANTGSQRQAAIWRPFVCGAGQTGCALGRLTSECGRPRSWPCLSSPRQTGLGRCR